jgi:hypothetical protein
MVRKKAASQVSRALFFGGSGCCGAAQEVEEGLV